MLHRTRLFSSYVSHDSSLKHLCISVVLVITAVDGGYHAFFSKVSTPPAQFTPDGGHSVHLFAVLNLYVPVAHVSHAALLRSGTAPLPQPMHAVALTEVETFPTPHALHAVAVVMSLSGRYSPCWQSEHDVSPVLLVNCPSMQASHVVSTSAAEAVPNAQNLQASSKVHVNADVSRYFPATQELQKMPAESRTFPVGHSLQAEAL